MTTTTTYSDLTGSESPVIVHRNGSVTCRAGGESLGDVDRVSWPEERIINGPYETRVDYVTCHGWRAHDPGLIGWVIGCGQPYHGAHYATRREAAAHLQAVWCTCDA